MPGSRERGVHRSSKMERPTYEKAVEVTKQWAMEMNQLAESEFQCSPLTALRRIRNGEIPASPASERLVALNEALNS